MIDMTNNTNINTTPKSPSSSSNNNVNVFPIAFGVAIGALSIISIIVITSYVCSKKRAPPRRAGSSDDDDDQDSITIEVGLDEATLNSYPKLVYSQAKLAKKENGTNVNDGDNNDNPEEKKTVPRCCSICLQEYKDTDVVRLVPECEHLYHVDCIDPWLKVNRTCPVCRSSPVQAQPGGDGPEPTLHRQRLSYDTWFVQLMR